MRPFGKRGSEGVTVIGFIIISLVFALMFVPGLLNRTLDDIKGHTLEKNYLARDIALLMDAVYASPGDLEYVYSMKRYKYVVEFGNGQVRIAKPGDKGSNAGAYDYFDNGLASDKKLDTRFFPLKDSQDPLLIIISKKDGVVSVSGQNFAAGDSFGGGKSGGGGASR